MAATLFAGDKAEASEGDAAAVSTMRRRDGGDAVVSECWRCGVDGLCGAGGGVGAPLEANRIFALRAAKWR